MEPFDKDKKLQQLFEQFKKIDKLHKAFIIKFSLAVFDVIKLYYPNTQKDQKILEMLDVYGRQILNSTESIIDKDKSYPDYRKKEEVEIMDRLALRASNEDKNPEYSEAVHKKAKELIVNHFSDIEDLSPEGFRLLEKYTKMYNMEFIFNFRAKEKV